MANPPSENVRAIGDRLAVDTGKTLAQWTSLARRRGPKDARACAKWLERAHGLGHFQAQVVAGEACGASLLSAYEDAGELVRALYIQRESLLPLHERVIRTAQAQGADVRVSPCRSYVSLSRKKRFATVRPNKHGVEVRTPLGQVEVRDDRDLDTLKCALADAYERAL